MTDFEERKQQHLNNINLNSRSIKELKKSKNRKDKRTLEVLLNPQDELELRYAIATNAYLDDAAKLKRYSKTNSVVNNKYPGDNKATTLFIEMASKRLNKEKICYNDYLTSIIKEGTQELDIRKYAEFLVDFQLTATDDNLSYITYKLKSEPNCPESNLLYATKITYYLMLFQKEFFAAVKSISSKDLVINEQEVIDQEEFARIYHEEVEKRTERTYITVSSNQKKIGG